MRDKPFVPTHKLRQDIPQLNLTAGTPVRQINPFADGKGCRSDCMCYTKEDWENGCRTPWLFIDMDIEPLPEWPAIQQEMIDAIAGRTK